MKIGLFIDTLNVGGAETTVCELAARLKEAGHRPVVLHFGNAYVARYCSRGEIMQELVPYRRLYKKALFLPLFALRFSRFLTNLDIDCLHSHLHGAIVSSAPAARLASIAHVGTLHDVHMIEEDRRRKYTLRLAQLLGTRFIVVANYMLDYYRRTCGIKPNRITYIANWSPRFDQTNGSGRIRAEFSVPDEAAMIVSVGRLVGIKRFDLLIEALSHYNFPEDTFLLIVGDGPLMQELRDKVAALGLTRRIAFTGERHDIGNILKSADIFALSSDSEGMSKSILEAISAGLPIVATDVGGNSELVEDKTNGFLSPRGDTQKFREHLATLVTNSTLRAQMAKESLEKSERDFSYQQSVARHIETYRYAMSHDT